MTIDSRYLLARLKYLGKTQEEVVEELGMARSTFWRKLNENTFSIREVHRLMEVVPLSMEDVERIFFYAEEKPE